VASRVRRSDSPDGFRLIRDAATQHVADSKPTRDVGFSHRRSEGVQPVRKWIAQYTVKMTAKKNAIEKSRSAIAFIILILPLQDNQPRSLHGLSNTEVCNLSALIFGNTASGTVCSARLLVRRRFWRFGERLAKNLLAGGRREFFEPSAKVAFAGKATERRLRRGAP